MDNTNDTRPRERDVMVGGHKLVVEEFSAAKRDAVLGIVLEGVNVPMLLKPLLDVVNDVRKARKNENEEVEVDLDMKTVAEALESAVRNILTRDMTQVDCAALDTLRNRQTMKIEKPDEVAQNNKLHFEFHPKMWSFVKNTITVTQEPELLEAIIEVNDVPGLVKKYLTLAKRLMSVAGEAKKTSD